MYSYLHTEHHHNILMLLDFRKGQLLKPGGWFDIFVAVSNKGPVTRSKNILTRFKTNFWLNIIHHIHTCDLHMHKKPTVLCTEPKV